MAGGGGGGGGVGAPESWCGIPPRLPKYPPPFSAVHCCVMKSNAIEYTIHITHCTATKYDLKIRNPI